MKESTVEGRLVRAVKAAGGLCLKFTSPSCAGVPDRIIILPGGRVVFAEVKADAGRLSKTQARIIDELISRGCDARVIRGAKGVEDFSREVLGR